MATRTTSAIEAYNGVLGRLLPKRGQFFKFVSILRDEEFHQSRNFHQLVESGGICGAKKIKRAYAEKAKKISEASDLLEKGIITPITFLNRMVYPNNAICTDLEPYEDIFEEDFGSQSEPEEQEIEEAHGSTPNDDTTKCIVCNDLTANTLLLPCKHLKFCNDCVLKIEARSLSKGTNTYLCPYCRATVEDSMQVFV